MSGKSKAIVAVDNTSRRTWDKEEYRKRAAEKQKEQDTKNDDEETAQDAKRRRRQERDPLHQGLIVARSDLKRRDYDLQLASRLGKTQVVSLNTPLNQQAGFYCNVCDCLLRDSQSYLDHINGKYHNRALGMNMRVERSTVDQVRQRLEAHKNKSNQASTEMYVPDGMDRKLLELAEKEYDEEEGEGEDEEEDEEARQERRRREEKKKEREKERQKEKEKEEKARQQAANEEVDPDMEMMALMGFGGFSTSKK